MLVKVDCERDSEFSSSEYPCIDSIDVGMFCMQDFRINKYPTIKIIRNGEVSQL